MTTSELERMMAQVNFKINNHFQKDSLTKKNVLKIRQHAKMKLVHEKLLFYNRLLAHSFLKDSTTDAGKLNLNTDFTVRNKVMVAAV